MGRSKHFYSIWKKMTQKNKNFEDIYDLNAVRILTHSVQDCYRILGLIHTQWRYLPQQFNDYIANPKVNGYSSLHTAVIVQQQIVEVQIRTYQMHEDAELGIAAHWVYKDSTTQQKHSYHKKLQTLRHLLEQDHHHSSEAFESAKEELFLDRIYVFTPKGDLYDLPKGATALDFAYHIHTDLGHHCCGARSQGKMLSLTEPLSNGMIVEIFKAERTQPSRDWLNPHYGYIKTARARQKVSHWFRSLDKNRHIQEGKIYFEKNMKRLALPYQGQALEHLLTQLQFKHKEDLYHALSTGDLRLAKVIDSLEPVKKKEPVKPSVAPAQPQSGRNIIFHELGPQVQYYLASCCEPSYPHPIVGIITRGRGIGVHKRLCPNILNISQWYHRLLFASWPEFAGRNQLVCQIEIHLKQWEAFAQFVLPVLLHMEATFDEVPYEGQWREGYPYARLNIGVPSLQKLSEIRHQLLEDQLINDVVVLDTTLP
jgi:GTP pyrophosphokinase